MITVPKGVKSSLEDTILCDIILSENKDYKNTLTIDLIAIIDDIKGKINKMIEWYCMDYYNEIIFLVMENNRNSRNYILIKCFIKKLGIKWKLREFINTVCQRQYLSIIEEFIINSSEDQINQIIIALSLPELILNKIIKFLILIKKDRVIQHGINSNLLNYYYFHESYRKCIFLVNEGYELNEFCILRNIKNTILINACKRYDNDFIKLLIDKGADVNIKNDINDTALIWACNNNRNIEIIQLLLNKGADVNIQSLNIGTTALLCACSNDDTEIIKLLLDNDAELNVKNSQNFTPLHHACRNNNIEIVKLFLKKNIEVNIQDISVGNSPLIYACINDNIEMVKILLEYGAEVNIKNNENQTPLHYAYQHNNRELRKLLVDAGAIDHMI
jgi:ankyrin repeat protein